MWIIYDNHAVTEQASCCLLVSSFGCVFARSSCRHFKWTQR